MALVDETRLNITPPPSQGQGEMDLKPWAPTQSLEGREGIEDLYEDWWGEAGRTSETRRHTAGTGRDKEI